MDTKTPVVCTIAVVVAWTAAAAASSLEDWGSPLPFNDEAFSTAGTVYGTDIAEKIVSYRREIHKHPELKYSEYKTGALVAQALRDMGVPDENIMEGVAITGVVAHIGAGTLESSLKQGKQFNFSAPVWGDPSTFARSPEQVIHREDTSTVFLLRADMDALPIFEETDVDFRSTIDGKMHACGHDTHTAMLIGAAMALKAREEELKALNGAVRLYFQPAEEGGAGAARGLAEGALNGVDAAAMLHTNPEFEVGTLAGREGAMMAQGGVIHIEIEGTGGHAAFPDTYNDAIAAAAAVITGLNNIVSRLVNPTEQAVLSLTLLRSGEGDSQAYNVSPEKVVIGGTIRTLTNETKKILVDAIEERATSIAASFNCTATVGLPPQMRGMLKNDRGVLWKPTRGTLPRPVPRACLSNVIVPQKERKLTLHVPCYHREPITWLTRRSGVERQRRIQSWYADGREDVRTGFHAGDTAQPHDRRGLLIHRRRGALGHVLDRAPFAR